MRKKAIVLIAILVVCVSLFGRAHVMVVEDFTDLTAASSNLSIVNGAGVNRWVIGAIDVVALDDLVFPTWTPVLPDYLSGNAVYITNDPLATPPPHTISGTSVSPVWGRTHFYVDIDVPSDALNVQLNLDIVIGGSGNASGLMVFLHDRDHNPVATTVAEDPPFISAPELNQLGITPVINTLRQDWHVINLDMPAANVAGLERRLVFTWRNHHSGGQPGAIISRIRISYDLSTDPPHAVNLTAPANNAEEVLTTTAFTWSRVTVGNPPAQVGNPSASFRLYLGESETLTTADVVYTGPALTFTPVTPLKVDTQYFWRVVPIAAGGAENTDAVVRTFRTAPHPLIVNFPHTQNFDSVTAFSLPFGWAPLNQNGAGLPGMLNPPQTQVRAENATFESNSAPNHLQLFGAGGGIALARTRPVDDIQTKQVSFWARATIQDAILSVGTLDNPVSLGSFIEIEAIPLSLVYEEFTVKLDEAIGDWIGFRAGANIHVSIDDVVIDWIGGAPLSVTMSAFSAVVTANQTVNIRWTTQSETNLRGFNVLRSESADRSNAIRLTSNVIPANNTTLVSNYSFEDKFEDKNVSTETVYFYWINTLGSDGSNQFFGPVTVKVETTDTPELQGATILRRAYPNPVHANSPVHFDLTVKENEVASLRIYNIRGQMVNEFVNLNSGRHTFGWNGTDMNGNEVSSGVYFYQLSSPSTHEVRRVVIVR